MGGSKTSFQLQVWFHCDWVHFIDPFIGEVGRTSLTPS